jgi:hypothetical protein
LPLTSAPICVYPRPIPFVLQNNSTFYNIPEMKQLRSLLPHSEYLQKDRPTRLNEKDFHIHK